MPDAPLVPDRLLLPLVWVWNPGARRLDALGRKSVGDGLRRLPTQVVIDDASHDRRALGIRLVEVDEPPAVWLLADEPMAVGRTRSLVDAPDRSPSLASGHALALGV